MYVHTAPLLSRVMAARASNPTSRALLLEGVSGTGKGTAALSLMKETSCSLDFAPFASGEDAATCDCESCRSITARTHPDLLIVRGDDPVQDLRDSIDRHISSNPAARSDRWLIVEHASLLRKASADSLLRVLESPPADMRIVLTASDADLLPSAIRSRCQHYRIQSPAPDIVERIIRGTPTLQMAAPSLARHRWRSIQHAMLHSTARLDHAFLTLFVQKASPAEVSVTVREILKACAASREMMPNEARSFAVRFLLRAYIDWLRENHDNDPMSKDAQLLILNALIRDHAGPLLSALERPGTPHLMNLDNQIVAFFTAVLIARSRTGA